MIKRFQNDSLSQSRLHLGLGVVIYAVFLGAAIAVVADLYELSFKFLATIWHDERPFWAQVPTWFFYAVGPFVAGPILYFILSQIPEKRAHNPADLITGIHIHNGKINAVSTLLTAVASALSIAFGFSVGYYAPTVQLGAGIGAFFHRLKWIRPVHAYISVGAGAAAAIAAIFHSPIGAVVFVHEVLFRFFSIRAFAPVTIAAVTAYVVSSELFDKVIFFDVSPHYRVDTITYVVAAVAGILAAIVGISMIRAILALQKMNHAHHRGNNAQLLIAAFITALIIMAVPEAAGSHLQAMDDVLNGHTVSLAMLAVVLLAKFLATTSAFGFGVPGGIFGPTIFIGATLGGLVAQAITAFYPAFAGDQQVLIITTMAAMLSAVLGAPIAMILIIVEITGEFQIISVVMLAVVMANVTAFRFMGTSSFFDIQLKSRGFNFDAGRDRLYAENSHITDLITEDYVTLAAETSLIDGENRLIEADKLAGYIVDAEGNLKGRVTLVGIERERKLYSGSSTVGNIMQDSVPAVYRNTSIWYAMQKMSDTNNRCLPVIDGEHNPKLLGVIYTQPLMSRYFEHLRMLRDEENVVS